MIDPAPVKSRHLKGGLATRLAVLAGDDEATLTEQVIYLQGTRGVKAREGFIRTGQSAKPFERTIAQLSSAGAI